MAAEAINSLEEHFSNVNDPRGPNVTHQLFDIIAIAILGTICGAGVRWDKMGQKVGVLPPTRHKCIG